VTISSLPLRTMINRLEYTLRRSSIDASREDLPLALNEIGVMSFLFETNVVSSGTSVLRSLNKKWEAKVRDSLSWVTEQVSFPVALANLCLLLCGALAEGYNIL
jgi:hypothetical protein